MFYAQIVLAKKGPLAKIWLAAHWDKKLTKQQIVDTDVDKACHDLVKPKVVATFIDPFENADQNRTPHLGPSSPRCDED